MVTPPSWINRRAEVWNESIMYPREMETGSKETDGGGEGKSLAYERGSVRGDRFCVIINRIVSTCTGNVLPMIIRSHYLMYKSNKLRNIFLKKQGLFNLQTF